ncbi:MAG TPA: hypothetical protein VHE99_10090 [Gammaproteobacteria bacterium]|nr:hypothetical protein [Gammaproteobacteria bacterium]
MSLRKRESKKTEEEYYVALSVPTNYLFIQDPYQELQDRLNAQLLQGNCVLFRDFETASTPIVEDDEEDRVAQMMREHEEQGTQILADLAKKGEPSAQGWLRSITPVEPEPVVRKKHVESDRLVIGVNHRGYQELDRAASARESVDSGFLHYITSAHYFHRENPKPHNLDWDMDALLFTALLQLRNLFLHLSESKTQQSTTFSSGFVDHMASLEQDRIRRQRAEQDEFEKSEHRVSTWQRGASEAKAKVNPLEEYQGKGLIFPQFQDDVGKSFSWDNDDAWDDPILMGTEIVNPVCVVTFAPNKPELKTLRVYDQTSFDKCKKNGVFVDPHKGEVDKIFPLDKASIKKYVDSEKAHAKALADAKKSTTTAEVKSSASSSAPANPPVADTNAVSLEPKANIPDEFKTFAVPHYEGMDLAEEFSLGEDPISLDEFENPICIVDRELKQIHIHEKAQYLKMIEDRKANGKNTFLCTNTRELPVTSETVFAVTKETLEAFVKPKYYDEPKAAAAKKKEAQAPKPTNTALEGEVANPVASASPNINDEKRVAPKPVARENDVAARAASTPSITRIQKIETGDFKGYEFNADDVGWRDGDDYVLGVKDPICVRCPDKTIQVYEKADFEKYREIAESKGGKFVDFNSQKLVSNNDVFSMDREELQKLIQASLPPAPSLKF